MKRLLLIASEDRYEVLRKALPPEVSVTRPEDAKDSISKLLQYVEGPVCVHNLSEDDGLSEELKTLYGEEVLLSTEEPGPVSDVLINLMQDLPSDGPSIERLSFEILSQDLDLDGFPYEALPVIKRIVHATGDTGFASTVLFHPDAIRTGLKAIKEGRDIVTDVEMVRAGINQRSLGEFGGRVLCAVRDVSVSEGQGTRTERAIELLLRENKNVGIIAIGNSPTALVRAIEILRGPLKERAPEVLLIGMPVGFVRALESKVLLSMQAFPYITNISPKGGTPATVATVNALVYMAKTL
ncbi:MAG: hypothetical protein D6778_04880 [Nitrospirae bacterium]|nr:MAG: hypothetical protein D6778_04880 [Nitrospirota bacterium]